MEILIVVYILKWVNLGNKSYRLTPYIQLKTNPAVNNIDWFWVISNILWKWLENHLNKSEELPLKAPQPPNQLEYRIFGQKLWIDTLHKIENPSSYTYSTHFGLILCYIKHSVKMTRKSFEQIWGASSKSPPNHPTNYIGHRIWELKVISLNLQRKLQMSD